jgi:O-antigen ligase
LTLPRTAGDPSAPARVRSERAAEYASVLFLFLVPFAASGGFRATCLIAAFAALLYAGTWRAAWRDAPREVAALFAFFLGLGAASLAWSVDRDLTLRELRAESFYGLLAFSVFFMLATDARRWPRWWLAIFAGTALAFGAKLLQEGLGIPLWRHPPDGGVGPFSTHLVLVAPLLVALACPPPWGVRRSPMLLALALAALMLAAWVTRESWHTPNRIVWPALAAVFLAAAFAGRKAAGFELRERHAIRRVLVAAGLVISIAFVAAIALKSERFYRDDASFAASVERDLRPRLWHVAWDAWRKAPWLGYGLGREIAGPTFLPESPPIAGHPQILHSHNTLLNIALQLGILGLAAFVALLVALALRYARLLDAPRTSALGVMGLALLAGFLVKNLTDDFFHRHNAQMFWALSGMLIGLARARTSGAAASATGIQAPNA